MSLSLRLCSRGSRWTASLAMAPSILALALALLLSACTSTRAAPVVDESTYAYDELSSYLEADILPDKDPTKMAMADNHRLWPGGKVPYVIDFDENEHVYLYNLLLSAITRMNEQQCVNLFMAGSGAEDYVSIRLEDHLSSHLGRQGGEQVLTISNDANVGTIMHEFMHTLGFGHEHNRPDRDEYVTVYFDNIQEQAKPYFQKYGPGSGLLSDSTPYDYTSIMHATNQHSEDINIDTSKPVIERKDGQQSLGQRAKLTDGDKARMAIAYSCDMCDDPENESKLFRYPGNCNMYYQCAQRQAVPRNCPENLHFSVLTDRCDYANEANCTFIGFV